jgi:hypothetical protein
MVQVSAMNEGARNTRPTKLLVISLDDPEHDFINAEAFTS